jgi:DNA-directed RNA polymerase subunit beta'
VLDAFKDVGFQYATRAGVTISKNDVQTPPSKSEILGKYEQELTIIEGQYEDGEITQEERHEAVTSLWDRATNEVGEALYAHRRT